MGRDPYICSRLAVANISPKCVLTSVHTAQSTALTDLAVVAAILQVSKNAPFLIILQLSATYNAE